MDIFSKEAKNIIKYKALEISKKYYSKSISDIHLAYAILNDQSSEGYKLLRTITPFTERIKREILALIKVPFQGAQPRLFSPSIILTSVLKSAAREAKENTAREITSEYLLLAILTQPESRVRQIFEKYNITFSDIKTAIQMKKKEIKPDKDTAISLFCKNLNEAAHSGKLDPVIGRKREIERVIEILSRRTKNNPLLIGEPGVGKTAIVEGLAERIVKNNVPFSLRNKEIIALDIGLLIAGTKYRGEFEKRLKNILFEMSNTQKYILFIDEIHTIIGAGAAEGTMDAANMLKPALARGEIQSIGATTLKEYRKYIAKDTALERRLQPVTIKEPTKEETLSILKGISKLYEEHHKVRYSNSVMKLAVSLSERYISDRFFPDKAIDIIDEAGSAVRINREKNIKKINEINEKIERLIVKKRDSVLNQQFEKAAQFRDMLEQQRNELNNILQKNILTITASDIYSVVAKWTGIPINKISYKDNKYILNLEKYLNERVIAQQEAVSKISSALKRARVRIQSSAKPTGSFLFCGPSGTGKTLLAKELASYLFSSKSQFIRLDMSEYIEKNAITRLNGSPPGYIGYEEGGELTEKVRQNPYSVVLFDEIEKAHPDIYNILLQILEEGELTDNTGKSVNFRNTIIILTSNIGLEDITNNQPLGFFKNSNNDYKRLIKEKLKKHFNIELLNRIDETIIFNYLDEENANSIIQLFIDEFNERLEEKHSKIDISDNLKSIIAKLGYSKERGARQLRSIFQNLIEEKFAEYLLEKGSKNTRIFNNALYYFDLKTQINDLNIESIKEKIIIEKRKKIVQFKIQKDKGAISGE